MRRLTEEERELLSIYIDKEGTALQNRQAEELISSSAEAREWLRQVRRTERLTQAVLRAEGTGVDISRVTGSLVASRATMSRRRGLRVNDLLLSILTASLLIGGYLLLQDRSRMSETTLSTTDPADTPSTSSPDVVIGSALTNSIAEAGRVELKESSFPVILDDNGSDRGSDLGDVRDKAASNSGKFGVDQDSLASKTGEAEPLHLSINLHHSSARVIISDDQWSDTLRFNDAEDRVIALSTRISTLTDSLNADVARIAADTGRSARARADEILGRQMEYEAEVSRELETLRKSIESEETEIFDGACIEDPAVSGLS